MKLVEVVRGAQTSDHTVRVATDLALKMDKVPVLCKDTPGFIVNRVARPFYGEALRLLGENVASVEVIDRIIRMEGGFKMGPFELMDLIGIDVNYAVTKSVYEQFFHEPRFRPHPIQRQMVEAGTLGRKTGKGFYTYNT
jgi:3-hydroxybutyryl-CoA dehydrogenase